MKVALLMFVVVLALPGTAWAADAPPGDTCQRACGGNFAPYFENSPVVICSVPNSCTFTTPRSKP